MCRRMWDLALLEGRKIGVAMPALKKNMMSCWFWLRSSGRPSQCRCKRLSDLALLDRRATGVAMPALLQNMIPWWLGCGATGRSKAGLFRRRTNAARNGARKWRPEVAPRNRCAPANSVILRGVFNLHFNFHFNLYFNLYFNLQLHVYFNLQFDLTT